jgi:hypothetical protein
VALAAAAVWAVAAPVLAQGRLSYTNDSVAYLAGAEGLLTHGRVLDVHGGPLTIWPPGYPIALALVRLLPGDDTTALAFAHALGAWAWARGSGWLAAEVPSPWVRRLVPWAVLLTMTTCTVFAVVLSEALFLPLAVLALVAVARDLERPSAGRALAAAALLSVLPVIRYIGLVAIAVAGLAAIAHQRGRTAASRVATWCGLAAVPWLALAARNHAVVGRFSGRGLDVAQPRTWGAGALIDAVGHLLTPTTSGPAPWLGAAVLALAAVPALARPTPRRTVATLWVGGYLVAWTLAASRLALEAPNLRYLAPLLGPLIALLALAVTLRWTALGRAGRATVATALTVLVVLSTAEARAYTAGRYRFPPPEDVGDRTWADDPGVAWARALPPNVPVITDEPAAIYLHTRHATLRQPLDACEPDRWLHRADGLVAVVDFARVPARLCDGRGALPRHRTLREEEVGGTHLLLLQAERP